MRDGHTSFTAAFVATCRSLGLALPEGARLADDPFGAALVHPDLGALVRGLVALPPALRAAAWVPLAPLLPWALYMQVRTRALDDALRESATRGCDQVVILGAGLDARAVRLADALRGAAVYEVDHPSTQRHKRAALERAAVRSPARYLPWDFERDPLHGLPAALAALGHDASRPTFTLWEGVTMYLRPEVIEATLAAVRSYSAPSSRLAFNYIDRAFVERPGALGRVAAGVVRLVGEPFRAGLDPATLPSQLRGMGFAIERDARFDQYADALLPAPWRWLVRGGRRLAIVERTATASSA